MIKYKLTIILIIIGIFYSGCNEKSPKPVEKQEIKKVKKVEKIKEEIVLEKEVKLFKKLTPLEKCKINNGDIKNKYNLIVSAPNGSKVKILNIKPRYKECILLSRGKYHIQVSKKGYVTHKRWIGIGQDIDYPVVLKKKEIIKKKKKASKNKKQKIKKYSVSLFNNYTPHSEIGLKNCIGFYPNSLVESMLNISTPINYWDSITWSGKCKNGFMNSRGVLYFKSKKGLHVDLKGKMKNGFFNGKVYNFSKFKNHPDFVKDTGAGYFNIKLNTKIDYKEYQE